MIINYFKNEMLLRYCQYAARSQPRYFFTSAIRNSFTRRKSEAELASEKKRETVHYFTAIGLLTLGLAYAAVPLYRLFCQATSYGGTVSTHSGGGVDNMKPVKDRIIKVHFNADTGAAMLWNFHPQQRNIKVAPGETALAFYTATNPSDKAVIGISTYNVVPFEAGQYFNKIQCFCFEEQQLNPHEEVDMPVFFYIDPEYAEDPRLENCDDITLSYTFFEAKRGLDLPVPSYIKKHITQGN
ncbi:cytochrome c oxidase assembly protein COX11, mitochondrial [Diachasma alloeum]|uniref:cytochrome c oxidase assembly protein COX11, mitochondrial n=1 Tax=Diachasma alloeum TaxID=454923 RepID=UPI000738195B|nr:cytochrome c oxidase assembly protein COX11, mitochondrial [Diachasma alloeum]